MIERCCEVSQGRGDDPLCLACAERIPSLGFADKMPGANAAVVEAAVNGEGKVIFDPVSLEKVRDGVVDVCEHAAAGKVQDADVLRVGVVVTKEHGEREPAEEVSNRVPLSLQ
jgi:hypothetical protein